MRRSFTLRMKMSKRPLWVRILLIVFSYCLEFFLSLYVHKRELLDWLLSTYYCCCCSCGRGSARPLRRLELVFFFPLCTCKPPRNTFCCSVGLALLDIPDFDRRG